MSRRVLHALRLNAPRLAPSFSGQHLLRSRGLPSRSIATTLTPQDFVESPASDLSPRDKIVARKTDDLLEILSREEESSYDTWGSYIDLLQFLGLEQLPLEIHQRVLRRCVPSPNKLRELCAREYRARYFPKAPHPFEARLQAVIHNIRSAGFQPDIEDYHFILEQFAACGHYLGSKMILTELTSLQMTPTAKTYGLCLRALAHRLKLPCHVEMKEELLDSITRSCRDIIRDMRAKDIPFTSMNLDLAIRILKETAHEESFDSLVKFGYGIDLAFPDSPLLDDQTEQAVSTTFGTPFRTHQPLSTSALNTIIDALGSFGRISKMVLAFEVLTQPLPKPPSRSPSFDDDEDDVGVPAPSISAPTYRPPHAEPNTTTYYLLLKHASKTYHAVFARHYLVQAMEEDLLAAERLRRSIVRSNPVPVPPRLAINRSMIQPVFHLANKRKNIPLIQFTWRTTHIAIRRKKGFLRAYEDHFARMARLSANAHARQNMQSSSDASEDLPVEDIPVQSSSSQFFTPSAFLSPQPSPETLSPSLDVDSAAAPPPRRPRKPFNLDFHLRLMQRDLTDLEELKSRIEAAKARVIARMKERLGRRVWNGKNIYLADRSSRVFVSRPEWRSIARFKVPQAGAVAVARPPRIASRRERLSEM
ncbi:hypothetical protein DENSPDRAFT_830901 [Dentipellis sp. KUC8613]|nr:hypothetical protein DENSPDRAFT_830901 [Dentipellis sp. KUC8613]